MPTAATHGDPDMLRTTILLAGLALPAAAQQADEPVDPADFLAAVEGQTVRYDDPENPGRVDFERFLGQGRVRYIWYDGTCHEGEVFVKEGQLCFAYETIEGAPSCWRTVIRDGDLALVGAADGTVGIVALLGDQPLQCSTAPSV
ncbi:hypothetical protein BCF33_0531 [Hasllibacter halocynthiae]|uniref:Uncharacterized protein n=1 Tax=Hasllibacter halocynthiae TaxID=595589 RepID=A0A2T0X7K9_9RHOB|nr:hypothetical protein [Hasllibacter halocynthiae]PRY94928.1 hypothetical protein BCF33_0531 [Hasllibacter halocynthiae]